MTWTTINYPRIQMKSSVHNLFSASLYRVPCVACQLIGSSDLERSLLERDTWWIHWLVNSSNTEKVSLPLTWSASQLWKNCHSN